METIYILEYSGQFTWEYRQENGQVVDASLLSFSSAEAALLDAQMSLDGFVTP